MKNHTHPKTTDISIIAITAITLPRVPPNAEETLFVLLLSAFDEEYSLDVLLVDKDSVIVGVH